MSGPATTTPAAIIAALHTALEAAGMTAAASPTSLTTQPDGAVHRNFVCLPVRGSREASRDQRRESLTTRRVLTLGIELGHDISPKRGQQATPQTQALTDEAAAIRAVYGLRPTLPVLPFATNTAYRRDQDYLITTLTAEIHYDLSLTA